MKFDSERARANAQAATTEDLMDRITVYGAGMEPEAVRIIEAELARRGIGRQQIEAHATECKRRAIFLPDGTARRCSFCERPAIAQSWGWHRLWNQFPIFPRRFWYCAEHQPKHTRNTGEGR